MHSNGSQMDGRTATRGTPERCTTLTCTHTQTRALPQSAHSHSRALVVVLVSSLLSNAIARKSIQFNFHCVRPIFGDALTYNREQSGLSEWCGNIEWECVLANNTTKTQHYPLINRAPRFSLVFSASSAPTHGHTNQIHSVFAALCPCGSVDSSTKSRSNSGIR